MICADFCAGAVMITFGVLLGKVSLSQLLVIAGIESFFYALNEEIIYKQLLISDLGGSMVIHMFGAYFGLACSYFFHNKESMGNR